MKVRALRLHDLRRFQGEGIAVEGVGDGLNALIAPNEFGKTTLLEAFEALLLEKHTASNRTVAALQSVSGGAPLVSADIAFEDGDFRVEKRFLARRMARVIDIASGREIARGDAVQPWLNARIGESFEASPLALLWVRQGAATEMGGGQASRAAALTGAVADDAAALAGGERLRALRLRAQQELAKLVTDKDRRVKAAGPLGVALKETASLTAAVAAHDATIEALEADFEALRRARETRAGLADPAAQAREAARLHAARAALQEAQRAAAQRQAASAELALAQANQRTAQQEVDRFAAAMETMGSTARALAQARETDAAATLAESDAIAAALAARKALEVAACHAEAAAVAERAARAARQAVTDASERAALIERHHRATAIKAARDEARRVAAAIALSEADLTRLEALEGALRDARTRLEATRTRLRVTLGPAAGDAVTLDDAALSADTERVLDAPVTLCVGAMATVTVTPGLSAQAGEAALRVAKDALAAALATLGQPDTDAARTALARKTKALADARRHRDMLHALVPEGLAALSAALARLPEPQQASQDAPDIAAIDALAETTAQAAREQTRLRIAAERLGAAETEARLTRATAAQTLREAQSTSDSAQHAVGSEEERAATAARLAASLQACKLETATREATLAGLKENHDTDLAFAADTVTRLETAQENRRQALSRLDAEIAALTARIGTADGVEERRAAADEARAQAQATVDRIEAHRAALLRLEAALLGAESTVRERYFAPLQAALAPLVAHVFGPAGLAFDDATLAPATLERSGLRAGVTMLSHGAREQLAILTRLAYATLLPARTRPPVILDDALSFADDARLDRMFDVLSRLAGEMQIIVLSCHQESFAALGARVLHPMPWAPEGD